MSEECDQALNSLISMLRKMDTKRRFEELSEVSTKAVMVVLEDIREDNEE